jgi:hypothetical protein
LSSEISSQRYDDSLANAERVIPVHILISDDKQHKPIAAFETLRQGEEPSADDSGTKATQHFGVTKHEEESSVLPKAHNKSGDFNAGIRDEYVQDALSLTGDFDSKPTEAQTKYKHVELTHGAHQSSSEGNLNNNDAKLNQHSSRSQNRHITKKTIGESHEKMKPLNAEVNIRDEDTSAKQETLVKDGNTGKAKITSDSQAGIFETGVPIGRTFLPSNPRQLPHPFENPILTYLNKKQSSDSDSNSSDAVSKHNEANTSQNIRREVFHQQTIINPNPNVYEFLQQQIQTQQTNPAYYHGQYPTVQQQLNSFPNTHFYTYPAQADSPGNVPYTEGSFQGEGNQNTLDSIRDEVPQFPGNFKNNDNFVTTLNVYPAIASVMYTTPTTSFTSTSSAPLPSKTYHTRANLPYKQFFLHNPFRGVPSSVNLPETRLTYNGPQYSSRIQWPLANYFPIVIKDPFLSMYNVFTSMIEYGPEADICKKTNSFRQGRNRLIISDEDESVTKSEEDVAGKVFIMENGGWKEMSKNGIPLPMERKMPEDVTKEDKAERDDEKDRDEKRTKDEDQSTEVIMETGGNGNAGPYITRLMVKKGGVSIAGPGGIATAGSGGTAIVGPGGVAYTSPNGLAVVGPGGKVVSLPTAADLSVLMSKVATSSSNSDGSTPRLFNIPPGGKVVATGPVVYFHPPE